MEQVFRDTLGQPFIPVPLDHDAVVQSRRHDYIYRAVEQRIEADLPAIQAFFQRIEPFYNHDNLTLVPDEQSDEVSPFWNNTYFSGADARAAYAIVAALKPRRIVEIGSGNSTKFMARARSDFELDVHLTSIDPEPRAACDILCNEIIRASLLDVDVERFAALEANDILFLDGSHLTFNGTDTTHFFLDVLPVVRPGVVVHVHDISLPQEYPQVFDCRGYSEQYMLAAALLFSTRLKVLLPVHFMSLRHMLPHDGVSFWFTVAP